MQIIPQIISPSAITGAVTDWAPTDLGSANVIRVSLSGAATINSLTGGVRGRQLVIENVDATYSLTLKNDDGATGTAANRFLLPNSANLILPPRASTTLVYDGSSARWRSITSDGGVSQFMQIVTESGTTRTITAADNNALILATNGSGLAVTVPQNLPPGMTFAVVRQGGALTVSAGSGVTFTAPSSATSPPTAAEAGATIGVVITSATTAVVAGKLA